MSSIYVCNGEEIRGYSSYYVCYGDSNIWYQYEVSPYSVSIIEYGVSKHRSPGKYAAAIKKRGQLIGKFDYSGIEWDNLPGYVKWYRSTHRAKNIRVSRCLSLPLDY